MFFEGRGREHQAIAGSLAISIYLIRVHNLDESFQHHLHPAVTRLH